MDGRVVCKKAPDPTTAGSYIATYYVYNDLNNLRYVIPPPKQTATPYPANISESDPVFTSYIYGYHYDERNRLIQKKIPNKGWEYMIYNKLNQVVLSQDAVLRLTNQWMATKYDALGRVIMTGLWPSAGQSQSDLQTIINNGPQWDARDYTDNTTGYNIVTYALPAQFLTINYYDNYTNIPGLPADFIVSGNSTMTKGLLTATKTLVLNTIYNSTLDMLCTAHYYDDLGRNVKTYQQHYLGGPALSAYNYDVITNTYDFTNEVTATTRQHYKNVSNTASLGLTVANTYSYDHMGRKTQTFEKINTGTNILLSQTDYNPIGQVMAKHLHSATGAAPFLQDISYKYNERGWLKRINNPAIAPTATQMFSEQLNYELVNFGATPKFNGNITEQMFQVYNSIQFPGQQHVVYTYDPLNRLNSGISTTVLNENVTYDNLGNITALTRGGAATGYYSYSDSYNANRLIAVSGLTNTNYIYDANGNMSHDGKNNATLTYNLLNLPQTVTSTTPSTGINITYTYDAEGQKLRKVSTAGGVTTNTDYISGIQYTNGAIAFIQTEEGRANNNAGTYTYEYTLTDHLGNNRVTFDQTNGKVGEEDYYPFGLNVDRKLNAGNKYLYNKKELQDELGQYDYGARFYDPVIGRFTTPDPLSEKSRRWSPYGYGDDNSIRNIDPDGMETEDANDGPGDLIQPTSDHFRHEHPILAVIHDIAYTITDITGLKDLENSIGHSGEKNVSTKDKIGNIVRATVNVLSLGEEGEGEGFHGEGPTIGKYSDLKEPKTVGDGLKTTPAQRGRILDANTKSNAGVLKSDLSGNVLDRPVQAKKGVKANMNQAEIDHIKERAKGGSNSNSNQRVLSKQENLDRNKKQQ